MCLIAELNALQTKSLASVGIRTTVMPPPTTSDSKLSSLNISESSITVPKSTPNSNLHNLQNTEHILILIHRLTDKFSTRCHSHPKPPVQQIGNYTLADLTKLYKKYKPKHKRKKHILLLYTKLFRALCHYNLVTVTNKQSYYNLNY